MAKLESLSAGFFFCVKAPPNSKQVQSLPNLYQVLPKLVYTEHFSAILDDSPNPLRKWIGHLAVGSQRVSLFFQWHFVFLHWHRLRIFLLLFYHTLDW